MAIIAKEGYKGYDLAIYLYYKYGISDIKYILFSYL